VKGKGVKMNENDKPKKKRKPASKDGVVQRGEVGFPTGLANILNGGYRPSDKRK
jgi:hypothetical protein